MDLNNILETDSFAWPEHGSALQPGERRMVGRLISQARVDGKTIGSPGADFRWDLSLLNRVISFHAPDMIFTAETGCTLDQAKSMIEAEGLWLPLDSTGSSNLLLADYLAQDLSLSWLSHRYGTLQDWAVSMAAFNDRGQELSAGAKLVKNAAGYQLAPLYIGARMALGPVLELSFRLLPMPTSVTLVHWKVDEPSTLMAASQHIALQCYPSGRGDPWEGFRITRLNGQWSMDGWTLYPSSQVTEWTRKIAGLIGEDPTELEVPPRENHEGSHKPDLRIQVRPTQVAELLHTLHSLNMDLICYPKAGAILLGPVAPSDMEVLQRNVLKPIVAKDGLVKAMTTDKRIDIPHSITASAERAIMERVKSILDPEGIFGPLPQTL